MEAVSLVRTLFGVLVLAVDAAHYFRRGDARQNVEIWSSSWADASCSELCRRACDVWNGPRQDSNTRPPRDIVLSPSSSWCGGTRPSSSRAASSEGCFERSFARVYTVVSVGE